MPRKYRSKRLSRSKPRYSRKKVSNKKRRRSNLRKKRKNNRRNSIKMGGMQGPSAGTGMHRPSAGAGDGKLRSFVHAPGLESLIDVKKRERATMEYTPWHLPPRNDEMHKNKYQTEEHDEKVPQTFQEYQDKLVVLAQKVRMADANEIPVNPQDADDEAKKMSENLRRINGRRAPAGFRRPGADAKWRGECSKCKDNVWDDEDKYVYKKTNQYAHMECRNAWKIAGLCKSGISILKEYPLGTPEAAIGLKNLKDAKKAGSQVAELALRQATRRRSRPPGKGILPMGTTPGRPSGPMKLLERSAEDIFHESKADAAEPSKADAAEPVLDLSSKRRSKGKKRTPLHPLGDNTTSRDL